MNTTDRKQYILAALQEKGLVDIQTLADELEVSSMTIRRDLKVLAANGSVRLERGLAVLSDGALREYDPTFNHGANLEQKRRIARYCAGLVDEGDSVFLDAGTTVAQIARLLKKAPNISILTNSLLAASALQDLRNSHLIMCPGEYRVMSRAFLGPLMDDFIRGFQIDTLFLSTEGISDAGVSVVDVQDGHTKQALIASARKVICVADSSKFGKELFYGVAPIEKIDLIVTDEGVTDEDRWLVEEKGASLVAV